MSSQDDDKLIEGHDYDGIQELNNPLPKWWMITFFLTIIFAIFYYAYYEILSGPSSDQELATKMQKVEAAQEAAKPSLDKIVASINREELRSDAQMMKKAKKIFKRKCAACHGREGQGMIGPNLTDKYWMHSKGDFKGVLEAIREGFPEKGMQAWKEIIDENQQLYLTEFVLGFQGTNPANPKEPQGELIE